MLEYGTITRDPAKLPEASLKALLARGFTHFMGNEQASKIVGKIRRAIAGEAGDVSTVSKEQVNAFRESNTEAVAQWTTEVQAEALKALDSGIVGIRTGGGPKADPFTTALNAIVRAEVSAILKGHGLKMPKGDEVITFANGETRTYAQMASKWLERNHDAAKRAAEKKVQEDARRNAKAVEAAKAVKGPATAEALGL